jgi:hypothetical protein
MRIFHAATLAVAALLLGACGASSSDAPGPTNLLSGNNQPSAPPPATFHAMFQPLQGILPYPNDLYFVGSTDGTLRLPIGVPTLPNAAAINALDGFSTTAAITVDFSGPIDATTLNPADVVVIRLTLDNATKGPSLPPAPGAQLPRPLQFGTDYVVYVSGDPKSSPAGAFSEAVDGAGTQLVIQPTHPLDASSGATNVGYIVLLTNGIKDTSGNVAMPDTDYATVRNAALADLLSGATSPTCASVTDAKLNGICRLTFGHLAIAAQGGLNPASVVLSFSFSTQSTSDTLNVLWATYQATPVAPGTIAVAPTGLTTKEIILAAFGQASPGYADVWAGKVTVPYYLTAAANPHDTAPLTAYWTAAGPPPAGLDPTSRKLTRFNPVPVKTSDQTIPVLVGVPDAARTGCVEPANGWPVVVFQHGIHLNRAYSLTVFDAYASRCFVVVAIDQPLHGIVDPTSPLYDNQLFKGSPAAGLMTGERTFDLDVDNNTTLAPGPDGVIDVSGDHFINLASLLTYRDNYRQAESDLLWLGHVLPTLSLGANKNGASDVDGSNLQLAGMSLGGITGMPVLAVVSLQAGTPNSPYLSGVLSVVGGTQAYLGRDSVIFGPPTNAGLAAASGGAAVPGATLYDNFFRDEQTAIDSGDPVNYVAAAVAARPILMQQVVGGGLLPNSTSALPDQYVPNGSTQRLIAAANFTRVTPGQTPLAAGHGAYVNFIYGWHASILTPASNAAGTTSPITGPTDAATFFEMQTEAVAFALARGQAVTIGAASPAVIQP